jgi:hypothetical protein
MKKAIIGIGAAVEAAVARAAGALGGFGTPEYVARLYEERLRTEDRKPAADTLRRLGAPTEAGVSARGRAA